MMRWLIRSNGLVGRFSIVATVGDDGDTLHLYYGGADTYICLATASIRELLEWLDRQERIEAEPMPIAEQSPPAL